MTAGCAQATPAKRHKRAARTIVQGNLAVTGGDSGRNTRPYFMRIPGPTEDAAFNRAERLAGAVDHGLEVAEGGLRTAERAGRVARHIHLADGVLQGVMIRSARFRDSGWRSVRN